MKRRDASSGFHPKFSITNAVTSALTSIERARGFLEAAKLSEDWIRRMGERALVLEAHHTTHIEGTRLTLEQSEMLMAGKKVPDADPDDVRELLNYRKAFDLVSEYLEAGDPVTEGLIREIHKRLVAGVRGGSAAPGEYRKVQNYVVNSVTREIVYTPPAAQDVPILMADLVRWLNHTKDIHPVLVSGIAQFQLVHIHPFLDGNGRTSRLLSTLCLYRAGYDFKRLFTVSEYYDRDRSAFYRAIRSVRGSGMDMSGWLDYFTGGLATQMRETVERGKKAMRADLLAKQHGLNERQARILGFIFERGQMHVRDAAAWCPGVNRRTIQRDLSGMVGKGLLEIEGATNRLVYRLKESVK